MAENKWNNPAKRFVAFFDIMGFKELVERNSHEKVVEKLKTLKSSLDLLSKIHTDEKIANEIAKISESRSITFSDSIVIFSKSDTLEDASKILMDSIFILSEALKIQIPIKGVIAYGEVTVDFKNSLFFGKPIIDAYLLHEQLQMYSVIMDHSFERILNSIQLPNSIKYYLIDYKVNLKSGKITHKIIREHEDDVIKTIENVKKIYEMVSGAPRIYVDNTIEFLNSLDKKKE